MPEKKQDSKEHRDYWGKIGTAAGLVGALAAVVALPPAYGHFVHHDAPSSIRQKYDGPIAEIAVNELNWDPRGFLQTDFTNDSDTVTYAYAGHYIHPDTGISDNPNDELCKITLHANPSSTLPYGGESGFVFVQPASDKIPKGTVLHNPKLAAIYETMRKYEFVPQACYPLNLKFPPRK